GPVIVYYGHAVQQSYEKAHPIRSRSWPRLHMTRIGGITIGTLLGVSLLSQCLPSQASAAAAKDSSLSVPGRDRERSVSIVVLQAGDKHGHERNPGLEANFILLANLARQAAATSPRPDLIC